MDKIWLTSSEDKKYLTYISHPIKSILVHQAHQIQQQITRFAPEISWIFGDKKLIEAPLHPCAPNSDLASTLGFCGNKG